jgi:RimJ/RimL family protein N-acetyltransferase
MSRINQHDQPIGNALPDGWSPPPAPSGVIIDGARVRLEPINVEAHAEQLFMANMLDASGAGWTYLLNGPFGNMAEFRDWITTTCLGDDPMFYAFVDKLGGNALGYAAYLRVQPQAASIEVGHIRLSPLLQRTTIATEAMYLMMRHVFELGYRRYEWKCDSLNEPSRRAAERFGFTYEGTFRKATHYRGRNRDTAWFSITDDEWPDRQRAFEAWLDPTNFGADGQQRRRLAEFIDEEQTAGVA